MKVLNQIVSLWKLCIVSAMAIILLSTANLHQSYANPPYPSIGQPVYANSPPPTTSSNDAITNTLCRISNELTGGIGKAISIIIVISLAIALFLGKVTWGVAIAVAVGMGILFGAKGVVDLIAGGGQGPCG